MPAERRLLPYARQLIDEAGLVTIVSGLREGDKVALRDPVKAVDELVPSTAKSGGSRP